MKTRLSRLQREILEGFFKRQEGFFLTGGGALVGYHLGHRNTEDLDLFTREAELDDGERALLDTARDLGAEIEAIQTTPEFRRRLVRRGDDAVLVDLVFDRAPYGDIRHQIHGDVAVDPPEEILANKLCTLLSRAEIRDVVDVLGLERSGQDLDAAVERAARKDAGLTPAQLAWVLSEIEIGDDAEVPGPYSVGELRTFLESLQQRLIRLAFPDRRNRGS